MKRRLAFCLLTALAVSCGPPPPNSAPPIASKLPDTTASYDGLAWFGDDLVAARASPGEPGSEFRLVTIDPDTGLTAPVDGQMTSTCVREDAGAPQVSEGTLGWVERCESVEPGNRTYTFWRTDDIALEPTTDSVVSGTFILRSPGPWGESFVASSGSIVCESLVQVSADAVEPLSVVVDGPGGTFETGGAGADDCTDSGIAFMPVANGLDVIAFLASTDAIGIRGIERLDQVFDLYLTDGTSGAATRTELGLKSPTALAWMPDGRSLLVSGQHPDGAGTWILDPDTGDRRMVLPFAVTSIAFSPDLAQLAAVLPAGDADPTASTIIVADLPTTPAD
jgi:hypothetical protein